MSRKGLCLQDPSSGSYWIDTSGLSSMTFRDYFSDHAQQYAQYRPHYPRELFDFLSGIVPRHELVWDCGTGNGQAALSLAQYFGKVVATTQARSNLNKRPGIATSFTVCPAKMTPGCRRGVPISSQLPTTTPGQADKGLTKP